MTVHLISVGKSLFEALAKPQAATLDRTFVRAVRDTGLADLLADAGGRPTAASEQLAGWLGTLAPRRADLHDLMAPAQLPRWPAWFSAELETFAEAGGGSYEITGADLAVLIATDTVEGLTAAAWNAAAMVRADLSRVRYLATPDELGRAELRRGRTCALIVRVPGLDAGNEQGFRAAMRSLGGLGRSLLGQEAILTESFRVHLSGGFKAAIPYLIGVAEGLRSLPSRRDHDVRAFVLHDTKGTLIPLPLRRMDAAQVREELARFGPDGEGPAPMLDWLEGYAYDKEGGDRYRMTPFGEGLRALLGDLPEALAVR